MKILTVKQVQKLSELLMDMAVFEDDQLADLHGYVAALCRAKDLKESGMLT